MEKIRVLSVFGTRPEAVKMAPVVRALASDPAFDARVCVTAQHREMLDQVLELFNIAPDYDLDIMQAGQGLSDITCRVVKGLEPVIREAKPEIILVHGDTTTTFSAALAAFYQGVRVGHVEAGLRSFDKFSPFPEEMNRSLTGRLADLHFAPTDQNVENLIREGVDPTLIEKTGNTVIDALLSVVQPEYHFEADVLNAIDYKHRKVILLTAHRRENLGEPMHDIFSAIRETVDRHPEVELIFPMHKNPAVREIAEAHFSGSDRIHRIEPLDYEPFAHLMSKVWLILTDSGGIQEEAPALGKPVLVLRRETERPEAIKAGTVKLVGVDKASILEACETLLTNPEAYHEMANAVNPYGDGHASGRILKRIKAFLRP
jgi:UDP-N-acetylglucosamine 2-epimerase (non-hydrolysing)